MPLKVCVPCERLFLFEEETSHADGICPYCAAAVTQPSIRSMRDLPRFRLELVRSERARVRRAELTERIAA